MEEVINYGWLSLIPAVIAVVLAFATRNVVLSLAISLFLGIMIQFGANPWLSLQHLFSDYLFVDFATDNNPQTIIMMITVGGFVALIEKSGGARAFAKAVANSVNSKINVQKIPIFLFICVILSFLYTCCFTGMVDPFFIILYSLSGCKPS